MTTHQQVQEPSHPTITEAERAVARILEQILFDAPVPFSRNDLYCALLNTVPQIVRTSRASRAASIMSKTPNREMVQRAGTMIPRRNCTDLWCGAERTIAQAKQAVEESGAHPLLTEAVLLLTAAQEHVADWVELPVGKQYVISRPWP